jgi:hypothetical protein
VILIPRSIKFAHVALLVFSALLAFFVLRALDEETILGESARISVTDSDNTVDSAKVVSEVGSFAEAQEVNVGHQLADLDDPDNIRQLYLAVGNVKDPSASWLADGYPNFSRDFRTDVQPLGEISRLDPRGTYVVFGGSPQIADELLAEFEGLGFSGQVVPKPSLYEYVVFFGQGAVKWSFLVVVLAAVVAIGSGVLLNAKAYGVLRLQGKSFVQILVRDMAQLGAFWVRAAAIIAVAVMVCLAVYNGLNRMGLFALIAAGMLTALTVLALAAHMLALMLTYRTRIMEAIKGEVSATLAMVSAYGLRIPAALLAFAIFITMATTGQEVAERQASRDAYASIGDAASILLYANTANRSEWNEIKTEMDTKVGRWIQRSQRQREVIIAAHSKLGELAPDNTRISERDVLVVNNTYLAEQPVLDPSGDEIRGVHDPENKAKVLIPDSLSGNEDRFVDSITEWLKFQAEVAGGNLDAAQVETLPMRSGQSMFTYGSGMGSDRQTEALVRDPIILVVPGSSSIFGNAQYTAYATQSGVIFKDPGDVRAAMSTEVGDYLVAMRPVAQHAADEYQDLIGEFRLKLFNVAAALAVLLITAISVGLIYCRKNAQALFVKHISGWTFAKAYWPLLALESLFALALIGGIGLYTLNTIRDIRARKAAGVPLPPGDNLPLGGWMPAVMLAISILSVVAIIIVLAVSHRRLVKQRAAED